MLDALSLMQAEAEQDRAPAEERTIPLYHSPAAAGYAAPVFGEDYELLPVTADVPPRGGAGGANPRGQHGALYPGRVRGVCEP